MAEAAAASTAASADDDERASARARAAQAAGLDVLGVAQVTMSDGAGDGDDATLPSISESVLEEVNIDEMSRMLALAVAESQATPEQQTRWLHCARALHSQLTKSVESALHLQRKAKAHALQLAKQQNQVSQNSLATFDEKSLVGEMTRDLLRPRMELELVQGRLNTHMLEIEQLEAELGEQQRAYELKQEQENAETRPALERDVRLKLQLEAELAKRKAQFHELRKAKVKSMDDMQATIKAKVELHARQKALQIELAKHKDDEAELSQVLAAYRREVDQLRSETGKRNSRLESVSSRLMHASKDLKEAEDALANEHALHQALAVEITERQRALAACQAEGRKIQKQVELSEEHLGDLRIQKRQLDYEAERARDKLGVSQRDKLAAQRNVLAIQGEISTLEEHVSSSRSVLARLTMQMDHELSQRQAAEAALAKAVRAMEFLVVACFSEESVGKAKAQEVTMLLDENKRLESELTGLQLKERGLRSQIMSLTRTHDGLARACTQMANELRERGMQLRTADMAVADYGKSLAEQARQLRGIEQLKDLVKAERNRHMASLQQYRHEAAEFKEKFKVVGNEIEILRAEIAAKDKEATANALALKNTNTQRDALQLEVNKYFAEYGLKRQRIDQQLAEIEHLNVIINSAEADMLALKAQYEQAVEDRNYTGIQLIDRNDELCILYEKANFQEKILRTGDVELRARDEEARFLVLEHNDTLRKCELKQAQGSRSDEQESVAAIESLTSALKAEQARVAELAAQLEDPQNVERWRPLPGADPSLDTLHSKAIELEQRLNAKEEALLEKTLVLDEVTNLAARLRAKSAAGSDDSLALAKKINEYQAKLRETTRKMMALVSELSIVQASALQLQQDNADKVKQLSEANERLAAGEAPTADAVRMWADYLERQRRSRTAAAAVSNETLDDAAFGPPSTAAPRINAYIPHHTTGELPLPKPYMYPRFEPSQPGSTMRHTREPKPVPIEFADDEQALQ